MKLSEAILLGGLLHPQGRYFLFSNGHTCVMGGALTAQGVKLRNNEGPRRQDMDKYLDQFGWGWILTTEVKDCPSQGTVDGTCPMSHSVRDVIVWLSDHLQWSRPRIAAWVATVEPQESLQLTHQVVAPQRIAEPCHVH